MALAVVVVEEEEGAMEAARMAERTYRDAVVPPRWRQQVVVMTRSRALI